MCVHNINPKSFAHSGGKIGEGNQSVRLKREKYTRASIYAIIEVGQVEWYFKTS